MNPVPFYGQSYQNKRGLEIRTSCSSGYKTSSEKFLFSCIYLTKFDDTIWSSFWVIPKITSAKLFRPIHDINYSTSIYFSILFINLIETQFSFQVFKIILVKLFSIYLMNNWIFSSKSKIEEVIFFKSIFDGNQKVLPATYISSCISFSNF